MCVDLLSVFVLLDKLSEVGKTRGVDEAVVRSVEGLMDATLVLGVIGATVAKAVELVGATVIDFAFNLLEESVELLTEQVDEFETFIEPIDLSFSLCNFSMTPSIRLGTVSPFDLFMADGSLMAVTVVDWGRTCWAMARAEDGEGGDLEALSVVVLLLDVVTGNGTLLELALLFEGVDDEIRVIDDWPVGVTVTIDVDC